VSFDPVNEKSAHWDAALIVFQVRVLELGSGCGLLGLGVATSLPNAHVLLTDPGLPVAFNEDEEPSSTLEWLRSNVALNDDVADRVDTAPLLWGAEAHIDSIKASTRWAAGFDLIIGSDLLYNPDSYELLLRTMLAFRQTSTPPLVVLGYPIRHGAEQRFLDAASQMYTLSTHELNVSRDASAPASGRAAVTIFTPLTS